MRSTRPDHMFRREYMCEFTTPDDRLFDRDIVEAMFENCDREEWIP